MSIKIVFMGSPELAAKVLRILVKDFPVMGVITQPDRPAGRGNTLKPPAVKILADELGIPVMQPERLKHPDAFAQLESWKPDLIVVAAYGQILRQNVLDLPQYGCINVHASYLPRWRGAAPIQAAILHGDAYTGVSIMRMDAGIDTGPVLLQEKVFIDDNETLNSLSDKLADVGGKALVKALPLYLNGSLIPQVQENDAATYAAMLKKEDGLLDFTESAVSLDRKVRALNDWPGTYMLFVGQPLKIRKVEKVRLDNGIPGVHTVIGKFPAIFTPDGAIILKEVQPPGKKWMSGADFLRGTRKWILEN